MKSLRTGDVVRARDAVHGLSEEMTIQSFIGAHETKAVCVWFAHGVLIHGTFYSDSLTLSRRRWSMGWLIAIIVVLIVGAAVVAYLRKHTIP
jgi:hypothetical protein